jgi:hypothetical protein
MADESVRDVVRRVRSTLLEKGPAGSFLLAELDAAILRGVDDLPVGSQRGGERSDTPGKRSPNEAELIEIIYSVFDTYLVTLPSVAASLTNHLREKFGVDHCEVTLDRSLLGDELQLAGRARIDAIVPLAPDRQVAEALGNIARLLKGREE